MTSLGNIQQIRRQTAEIKTLKEYLFDNALAAHGLLNTLSDAKRNSSRVSALLRQQFID